MKPSKRNIEREAAREQKRAGKAPVHSKYAAKVRAQAKEAAPGSPRS